MSATLVKDLRERTGAGIKDCVSALAANNNDVDKAIDWLRTKGITNAAKKSGRAAAEGLVEAYIHAGGKIGVILEVNCETDFVALNQSFKDLVKGIAMHIAASSPEYVRREEVPAEAVERERKVQLERVMAEGKPEAIAAKIVDGRMSKFYEEVCLLDQKYIKDDSKTVDQVVKELIASIGENILVRRFVRYTMGEGLQKRADDFAAEVAAQAGAK